MVTKLRGYASRTTTPYEVGFYTETIKRGAFKRTLGSSPDVQLLINHSGIPLARTSSGTLRLSEDDKGLLVDADLDEDRSDVSDVVKAMHRGDIDQMSFAFRADDQTWNADFTERTINSLTIHRGDVSIVNQGANPTTHAALGAPSSTVAERKRIAEMVGRDLFGTTEFRAFSVQHAGLVTVELEYRAPSVGRLKRCARCGGGGGIVLQGRTVPCPNCGGKGHSVVSGPNDGPHASTATDGTSRSLYAREAAALRAAGRSVRFGSPRSGFYRGMTTEAMLGRPRPAPSTSPRELDRQLARSLHGTWQARSSKYTQKEIDALGKAGKAFKNPDGTYSYPITTVADLQAAIHAVGRGGASHKKIREWIRARAVAMGQLVLIPDTWAITGNLKSS